MRINKRQTAVITLLSVAIVVLVGYLLFFQYRVHIKPGADGGAPPPVQTPAEHEKLRKASSGKDGAIVRETRLMGSGDETVVACYRFGGVTYVFGNATVGDLDFGVGGFLCMLDGLGSITGFTYFDGKLTAAAMAEGGFAVAATEREGERSLLYSVTPDGTASVAARPSARVIDVLCFGGTRVCAVTQSNPYSLALTEYDAAGGQWTAGGKTEISGRYELTYFDCYYMGGQYIISARARTLPNYDDALVFYSFTVGGNAASHYYGGSGENSVTPYAVMPYADGFVGYAARGGVTVMLTVDYTFTRYTRAETGFNAHGACFTPSDGAAYACFDCDGGYVTFAQDDALARRIVSAANGVKITAASGSAIAGGGDTSLKLIDTAAEKTVTLSAENSQVYAMFSDGGTVTAVISAKGGASLSAPSGGSDIYIITVKL